MRIQLHGGYVLSSVKCLLESMDVRFDVEALYSQLCCFEIQHNVSVNKVDDPIIAVAQNIISKGLPTFPSIRIEEMFSDLFGISKKVINQKVGSIAFELNKNPKRVTNPSNFFEQIYHALFVVDPRIGSEFRTYFDDRLDGQQFGSKPEELFFFEAFPKLFHKSIWQLLEPQRLIESIVGKNVNFVNQRVDFCVEFLDKYGLLNGLVVELDGIQHNNSAQQRLDAARGQIIQSEKGFPTIRIPDTTAGAPSTQNVKGINAVLRGKYLTSIRYNFDHPLWQLPGGLAAMQIALSPFAIARVQLTLLYLISIGVLDLEKSDWNLTFIERDVPCAALAIEDLKDILENLLALEGKGRKVPNFKYRIYSTDEFSSCEMNVSAPVVGRISDYSPRGDSDVVVDISMLQRLGIAYPEAPLLFNHPNYVQIRSNQSVKSTRQVKSAMPIKYRAHGAKFVDSLNYFVQTLFRKSALKNDQIRVLERSLSLQDVIGLLPTGYGKSLTYQLSTLLQPGVTLVIDPLKSLMRDQVDNLELVGIDSAVFINSSITVASERKRLSQEMTEGVYQFVFISPERLQIQEFRDFLGSMKEAFFVYCVVDEAHCVSEWGHDFRTSYLRLGENARKYCKTMNGSVVFFGLTGTASYDVLEDVQRDLNIDDAAVIRPEKFERENLKFVLKKLSQNTQNKNSRGSWGVVSTQKQGEIINILEKEIPIKNWTGQPPYNSVSQFLSRDRPKDELNTGLIFCPHAKGKFGVKATSNKIAHKVNAISPLLAVFSGSSGDQSQEKNDEVQKDFKNDKVGLLVATKAFGMGIDKPNVRFTIHLSMPQSVESFYQEAGRSGRDNDDSYCYILFSPDQVVEDEEVLSFDKSLMVSFHKNSYRGNHKEKTILGNLLQEISFADMSRTPGIETTLNSLKQGGSTQLEIGFYNACPSEIASLLDPSKRQTVIDDVVRPSYNFCPSSMVFIKRLASRMGILKYHSRYRKFDIPLADQKNIKDKFVSYRNEDDTYKAIYRLSIIGLIDDYVIDYDKKIVKVTIIKKSDEEYIRTLSEYVGKRVSREASKQVRSAIENSPGETVIQKCCNYLIDFVYQHIAKKRRVAIDNMESYIVESSDGLAFANKVNDYFNSRYTGDLQEYIRNYSIDLIWEFMEETLNDIDALKHLRGSCDRLLEENPENGAFLLLRAFARFLLIGFDSEEAMHDYREGLRLMEIEMNWTRKERMKFISDYYLMISKADKNSEAFFAQEFLRDHASWLKDFSHSFFEEVPNA